MRPVRIWVQGSFWDSQIYAGELTLFGEDGAMHRIDWAGVIDELAERNAAIQTALRVAFSDGDLFYTPKVQRILRDPAIEIIVKQQLCALADLSISGCQRDWDRRWRTTSAPFDFLPIDTEIYYHRLFAAGDEGLYSATRSASSDSSSRFGVKHHDGRVLQIKASKQNTAVAAATGADGLFEFTFNARSQKVLDAQRRVAELPCSACDWAFQSIVAWSDDSAFLANYREFRDPDSKRKKRTFDRIIQQEDMFTSSDEPSRGHTRTWGSHEKLFRISDEGLEVLDYIPQSDEQGAIYTGARFASRGKVDIKFDPTSIISTGTAPFGTVLEFSDKLVVLRSDGVPEVFQGEPVHWRVFPRSEHYSNQLHIIYEGHMLIVSFLHDYFVEQTGKLMGFEKGANQLFD